MKKGGNCPEKWDINEKLPKIAKFDRFLAYFNNLSPKSYENRAE